MITKYVFRNLLKRPFLNLTKVVGLSLSLSGILLMVLFLKKELTYDRFHEKNDRIFRLTIINPDYFTGKHFARTYYSSLIPEMKNHFPEIDNYVRLKPIGERLIKHEENLIEIKQAFICDSTFFEVFDSELLVGNSENILNNLGTMVISESYAKKVFGNTDPIGKIMTIPNGHFNGNDINFTIRGIMKDFPQNSHFHPEFIATPISKNAFTRWAWTYLVLNNSESCNKIISGFKDFFLSMYDVNPEEYKNKAYLQNIADIHLHSNKFREIETNSNMTVIYTFIVAAFILLVIALINYTSLNIGMLGFSDKYFFIRKVSGSSKLMSLKYYLVESLIISLIAIIMSAIIINFTNILIQNKLGLDLFIGNALFVFMIMVLFGLLVIMVGVMPVFFQKISKIKTTNIYKANSNYKRKGISKGLIIQQYTIAIALIIAVFVIYRQTDFALKNSLGAETKNLICIKDLHANVQKDFEIFKSELSKYSSIKSVSAMFEPPGGEANDLFPFTMEDYIQDEEEDDNIGIFPCDYSFASIFNLKFVSGHNFSDINEDSEGSGEYIINESAMKKLGHNNPEEIIDKRFQLHYFNDEYQFPEGKIIGVVEDFHFSSIKKKIEPLVFFKRKDLWLTNFVVSFQQGMKANAILDIENVWTEMFPEFPLQYDYVNAMYKNVYKTEALQIKLLSGFIFLNLFICSIGIIGLSLLITQRRTKEIGIRKVNGAKIREMIMMLNSDFIKLILISFVLSIPLAYYGMTKWLENYAYKTNLSWWIFALAGLGTLIITFLTVSLSSIKAATRNPVEALRYE